MIYHKGGARGIPPSLQPLLLSSRARNSPSPTVAAPPAPMHWPRLPLRPRVLPHRRPLISLLLCACLELWPPLKFRSLRACAICAASKLRWVRDQATPSSYARGSAAKNCLRRPRGQTTIEVWSSHELCQRRERLGREWWHTGMGMLRAVGWAH